MPTIFLTEDDVRELMDMETSIEVVEEAFRQFAAGEAKNVPRARAAADGILLHTMSASADYLGLVGWKAYTTTKQGARFHVAVYDIDTGEMAALIEANYLGQLRTGAASGVATEYMARPDAKVVGIFGSGLQARTQLKAVCTVRRIERVEVYSRNDDRRTLRRGRSRASRRARSSDSATRWQLRNGNLACRRRTDSGRGVPFVTAYNRRQEAQSPNHINARNMYPAS